MEIELTPNQIITLNDYPVYNDSILNEYFTKCKLGEELPFVPVIRKDVVKKYLDDTLLERFERFENLNPEAEYFMLDGSHRTTALTLAGCKITAIIYETDPDIEQAKKLVATGQILQNETLEYSLIENCEELNKHFREKPYFRTVNQKTEKMKRERILPLEMN
ncbi:hypothetical protein HN385_01055 [archaeon]|jgi:hypothetical protein|nr:hypothetical protein [archaeon]MBT3450603.1 hypothetical protein [archaeon]MBT6868711.1 hypothetical protein [archaeon]MBT7193499.1 hypothetical protein [archaeon]MBT7381090.1 hypothetical protein [archaeon]